MPYIVSFVKPVEVTDRQQCIDGCCIGGDLVLDQLLPAIEQQDADLQSNQEDWGWFAWFEHAGVKLAVDVHTNDAATGEFQVHLASRRRRLLLGARIQDTPELEALRELVVAKLEAWGASRLEVERVSEKYMPV
jgi:hypothetical protein